MNVLLIYPKPHISFDTTHCIPLGLGYIAAVLEKQGHKVKILDLNVQKDKLGQILKENNINITGMYAITPTIKSAWSICSRIKTINPNIITVLGGTHPTVLPNESLEKQDIDIIVRKEGEYVFAELCEKIEKANYDLNKANLKKTKGISYKKNYTSTNPKITHNPDSIPIKDLNKLPFPAYHLFPLDKYKPTRPTWISKNVIPGSMLTSRGCPFSCIFCFKGVHGNNYRYRSPENVIEEIKLLKEKYKITFLEFQDDNFNQIPERAKKICNLIIKENIDIKWSIPNGISRVENITNDFLDIAKKSGCVDIWFAIESGSQQILDNVINKATTIEKIKNAAKTAKDYGFKTGGFFCIGNPGEQIEDIEKTINLACSLDLDRAQFTIATPFPGTRLFELIKEKGELLITDWDRYGPFEDIIYFRTKNMGNTAMIKKMYKKAYRKFYLRPQYIKKALLDINTYKNLPLITKEIIRFLG